MNTKHVHYFDRLRLMAAISVVYMHVAAGPLRAAINTDWHFINILTCFAFTAVPLFLMMSGYLILNSEKTADISFLFKKRLPHLVVPLVGWSAVAILWRMIASQDYSISRFFDEMLSTLHTPAWIHLWYMYALIVLYIISPVLYGGLRSLDKKGHILVFSIICLISARTMLQALAPDSIKEYTEVSLLTDLDILGGTLAIFLLGYYLGKLQKRIPNIILIGAIILLLATIVIGTYILTKRNGYFDQTFQYQYSGFEVVLAACIFLLFKQNYNKPCGFFTRIPFIPLALPIYLMHNILLSMMGYIFTITTLWDTIYITVLNLFICYFTLKTVATIKPICYLATGMSFRTACETCNWVYTFRKTSARIKR